MQPAHRFVFMFYTKIHSSVQKFIRPPQYVAYLCIVNKKSIK